MIEYSARASDIGVSHTRLRMAWVKTSLPRKMVPTTTNWMGLDGWYLSLRYETNESEFAIGIIDVSRTMFPHISTGGIGGSHRWWIHDGVLRGAPLSAQIVFEAMSKRALRLNNIPLNKLTRRVVRP